MAAQRRSQRTTSAAVKNLKEPDGHDGLGDSDEDAQPRNTPASKHKAAKGAQDHATNAAPARKRQNAATRAGLHGLTLLEIILKHGNAIENAAKEWVERYRRNRGAAAAELMTLLVKAGGCDEELTEEDVEGGEVDQLAQRLTNHMVQDGGVDMFHHNRYARSFAAHYCLFWDKALRGLAAADLLFDDFELNDKLCRLVTALNISIVRSFRHAATLTAAQLISTWVTISEGLTESRDLAKLQLDAEQKKNKKGSNIAATGREVAAALRRTLDRCHNRVEDLHNFRSVTFTGVFSHRFRDVSDEIRAIVVESIGSWIIALPTEFLADTYLKYLAWALSDQSALVRAKAVAAISRLYSNSENVPRLHDFTLRFTSRFTELMYDIDDHVAAVGMRLLAQLVQHKALKRKDVSGVYDMLALPQVELRHAAAELVAPLLPEEGRAAVQAALEQQEAGAAAGADASQQQQAKSGKGAARSKGGRGGKALQPAAATGGPAAVAAAILEDPQKLQLAGLLAVMTRLAMADPQVADSAAAERRASLVFAQSLSSQGAAAAAANSSGATTLQTLPAAIVANLVDALWDHMPDVLGDVGSLADHLADEGAAELRGRLSNAHLAALLAAAVTRSVHGGGPAASGRKGRFGRNKAPVSATAANNAVASVDEDAQQEVTVALMQKLPELLTQYQAEPHVVAPLVAIPKHLRLELFALRGQSEAYRALLVQVDGLLQRHGLQELLVEAAGTLATASKAGPAALQEVGCQVFHTSASTCAARLAGAVAAVARLRPAQLAEGVADLAANPADAPDALLSLVTGLRRCHLLLAAGAEELAQDKQLMKTCQTLLQHSLEGRELGPEVTSLLLHVVNISLLWQQRAAASDPAAATALTRNRSTFFRVLEALLENGATEHIIRPEQLLADGNASSHPEVSAEVLQQISVGLLTLQDLAFQQLADLMFVAAGCKVAADTGSARLVPSMGLLNKCWKYCQDVLGREGPDVEALEAAQEEEQVDKDLIDWDGQGGRASAKATTREALSGAAACLAKLKLSVVTALGRVVAYRVLPEPGFSWLLAKLATLLDGYGPEVSIVVRTVLQHIRSSSPNDIPGIAVTALSELFDEAEVSGDDNNWHHLASVSSKLAGLYTGHNLSQEPLISLINQGIAWALQNPTSRAGFLPTCLGPFTSKIAPQSAEQVAGQLKEQLVEGGEVRELLDDDQEALEDLERYLTGLMERAAGKKPTKGVLRIPAAKAAGASGRTAKRGRIKFAADVQLQAEEVGEHHDAAPDGSDRDASAAAAARTGRARSSKRKAAASSAAGNKRAKGRQQGIAAAVDNSDKEWDDTRGDGEQQQQPGIGDWHVVRRSSAKRQLRQAAKEQQQQQRGRRQQQQQQSEQQEEDPIDESDDEQTKNQLQRPVAGVKRRVAAAIISRSAAAAPATSPASALKAVLRQLDDDAGPLSTQSQSLRAGSESQKAISQQQVRTTRGGSQSQKAASQSQDSQQQQQTATSRGKKRKAGAAAAQDEQQEAVDSWQQQEQQGEELSNGVAADEPGKYAAEALNFTEEQLPMPGRSSRRMTAAVQAADDLTAHSEEEEQQEDKQQYKDVHMADADEDAEQYSEEDSKGANEGEGGKDGQEKGDEEQFASDYDDEPLPSLQVVLDDMPEAEAGEEVDEPPATRRPRGRRRR